MQTGAVSLGHLADAVIVSLCKYIVVALLSELEVLRALVPWSSSRGKEYQLFAVIRV